MKKYLKLIRAKHYIKNLLIFFPLIFSQNLFDLNLIGNVIFGFFSFCFLSSAIYIINDIRDKENDRAHPTKKSRPIASGAVPVKNAFTLFFFLISASFALNMLISNGGFYSWVYLLSYFFLNVLYSFGLKNIPIVDIAILAFGFLLRVLYGSAITSIEISEWLYLTIIAMSFYLGLGKRRGELKIMHKTEGARKVLKYYNKDFLDKNMYLCLALTITFYSLWTVDASTIARVGGENLIWTVPLVILICMKYGLTIEGNSDGDPVEVVLGDRYLIVLILIFIAVTLGIIYF